ncbi:hypothetical protein C8A01DRAFT_15766 [Parachaetomium inaequale]|uniref:Zn(2)-C6 fungal-type domain-containing protein n=1 Tax=Parachaetomium inaequale TaxID=2588326 RepID=A0AAN6SRE8_9PEZI|nr:hypothetical protein C8A01DRAFT_15766 [Parachaetomium inaequale]
MEHSPGNGAPSSGPLPSSIPSFTPLNSPSRPRSVRRPRPVKSCIECRRRKLKCDRSVPCSQCTKGRRGCRYSELLVDTSHESDASDCESSERPAKRPHFHLAGAEDGHVRRPSTQTGSPGTLPLPPPGPDGIFARLERLETIVLGQKPVAHSHRASTLCRKLNSQTLPSIFNEAKQVIGTDSRASSLFDLVASLADAQSTLQRGHQKALEPITVFADSMMPIQKRMADILPPRPVCDELVKFYPVVSGSLYQMVHVASFQLEYAQFWGRGAYDSSFLPRLLCVLCIAARFGTESRGLSNDRLSTIHIPTACVLVRDWLDDSRKKGAVDLSTLQTELLLVVAQSTIGTAQQALWAQLGYVIRMAVAMGLPQDPSEVTGLSEFSMECRRKLWFAIMETDLAMSPHGTLSGALRGYSCKPPRNLDDVDLPVDARALLESKPLGQVTDNHFEAYSARTLPVRMEAAALLTRLDAVRHYREVVDTGAKLEKMLDEIAAHFPRHVSLDPAKKHLLWRRRVLLDMHLRLPLIALYRPFALVCPNCPLPISCGFLKSCMTVLRYTDELDPLLSDYKDAVAMTLFALQPAMTEAAFGVCWYIKQARESVRAGERAWFPPAAWYDGGNGNGNGATAELLHPISLTAMVQAVERSLETLIGLVYQGQSSHVGDLVALSVVLECVQDGETPEKIPRVEAKLGRIKKVCLQVVHSQPVGRYLLLCAWDLLCTGTDRTATLASASPGYPAFGGG